METNNVQPSCQALFLKDASRLAPEMIVRAYRFQGYLRIHGYRATVRKICSVLTAALLPRRSPSTRPGQALHTAEEILNLAPGEWVEVKSYEEIRQTLNADDRHRGLFFMQDMTRYCGHRLRVYKVVKRLLMEDTGDVRRMRNTVLLEGSMCDGLTVGCGRSCFHFWRETWLRRCKPGDSSVPTHRIDLFTQVP